MTEEKKEEKSFEELIKLNDEDFLKEYLKLRDQTDWGIIADFQDKIKLLNSFSNELKHRKIYREDTYGSKRKVPDGLQEQEKSGGISAGKVSDDEG
jgi:5'-deoxynucleotidase YfbR-like HD superfamily hydrolase